MSPTYSQAGPHIHSRDSVASAMKLVVLALLPATAAALYFFGIDALYPVFGTMLFSVLFEIPFARKTFSWRNPLGDGSACVAGLILGLSLSPQPPWWIPPLGAFLLVTIGKHAFGGLGNNIFNPALVARGILLLAWPETLTRWISPVDGISGATALEGLEVSTLSMFIGNIPGSLGETSAIAILLGGAFLALKGCIHWRIPGSLLLGAVSAALLFDVDPLFTILAGSLLFSAVFMVTDMTTTPTGKTAHCVFAFGAGFLTVFIRVYTVYPEGVTFAILLMNGTAYLMDRVGADPIFGRVQERNRRIAQMGVTAGAIAILALAVTGSTLSRTGIGERFATTALTRAVRQAFPTADRIVPINGSEATVQSFRVYRERQLLGRFADGLGAGYGGPMQVWVTLTPAGEITHVRIGTHEESPTLGTQVLSPSFLKQFEGFRTETRTEIRGQVDGISGATVSARAVMTAVERVLADSDRSAPARTATALPPLTDGVYEGTATGYNGPIRVTVTVAQGTLAEIEVTAHTETAGLGTRAMETLRERIIASQSLSVDGMSGATGSSRGLIDAVGDALAQP